MFVTFLQSLICFFSETQPMLSSVEWIYIPPDLTQNFSCPYEIFTVIVLLQKKMVPTATSMFYISVSLLVM